MSYVIVSGSGISPDCRGTYTRLDDSLWHKDATYEIYNDDVNSWIITDAASPGDGWRNISLIGTYTGTNGGHTGNPIVTGPFDDTDGGISGEEFMNEMWDF
jgi:hypothetical protein